MAQLIKNPTSIHENVGLIPELSELRIQCCHKLWCRLQMWLGSVGRSSDLTPSLGTSMWHGCGPKKEEKKKCKGENGETQRLVFLILYFSGSTKGIYHMKELHIF